MSGSGNLNATPNTCATTVCWTGVCFGRVGCPVCWCREPHERVPQGTHVEPRGRGPQGLSTTDLIPYTLYLYLVPCPGLIGHPMGSFETLYRSNWRSRWDLHDEMGPSIQIQHQMVDYDETMKRYTKNWQILKFCFGDFSIDPGVSGGHPGGSRTVSGAEKIWKNEIFKNWLRSTQITPYLGDPKFDIKRQFFYERNLKTANKKSDLGPGQGLYDSRILRKCI